MTATSPPFPGHCEAPKATKQSRSAGAGGARLLRCARNDGDFPRPFLVIARRRRRRSNPDRQAPAVRDCFASLAMTATSPPFPGHCEAPKATKQSRQAGASGARLLRFARNDGDFPRPFLVIARRRRRRSNPDRQAPAVRDCFASLAMTATSPPLSWSLRGAEGDEAIPVGRCRRCEIASLRSQ